MATSHAMAHADAAWLHMDRPTNLMVITSALWFDEPLDETALRELVLDRLVEPYPRFRQRVVDGPTGTHWEDDEDFDLDLHMHHMALPAPGDRAALQRVVGDLMSQPLDHARPLWSMHLLDGYGNGCALVVRMHHCIADGIALARVMLGLTDSSRDVEDHVKIADPQQPRVRVPFEGTFREAVSLSRGVAHHTVESLLHPSHLAELAEEGVADGRALARYLLAQTEREHPLHGKLGATQRVAWSRAVELERVRAAGHAHHATINDTLVACVAGTVRSHLQAQGTPAEDVAAMVPFNLRPLDKPLPRDLGNKFGLVLLDLPVGLADPVARVRETSRRMADIKKSRQGAVSYGILNAMGHAPTTVESRVVDLFSSKATMVLTNVPGPRTPVYLTGVPLAGVLVWAPASGAVGMSVSIFSYAGAVTVGFMVNGNLIEDAGDLVDGFEAALAELL